MRLSTQGSGGQGRGSVLSGPGVGSDWAGLGVTSLHLAESTTTTTHADSCSQPPRAPCLMQSAGLGRGLGVGNLKHVSRAPSQSLHHHTISVLCSLYSADPGPGLLTASLWCHKKYFGSVSYLKCDDRILLQQT